MFRVRPTQYQSPHATLTKDHEATYFSLKFPTAALAHKYCIAAKQLYGHSLLVVHPYEEKSNA